MDTNEIGSVPLLTKLLILIVLIMGLMLMGCSKNIRRLNVVEKTKRSQNGRI
jgi:hypothetical protein